MDALLKVSDLTAVDSPLGIVVGKAIVCTKGGEKYYDLQGEHITEKCMLDAAVQFLDTSQVLKEGHEGSAVGKIWPFPLTADICKALGLEASWTGMAVVAKPSPPVLAKIKAGELTGFSIGGGVVEATPWSDAA